MLPFHLIFAHISLLAIEGTLLLGWMSARLSHVLGLTLHLPRLADLDSVVQTEARAWVAIWVLMGMFLAFTESHSKLRNLWWPVRESVRLVCLLAKKRKHMKCVCVKKHKGRNTEKELQKQILFLECV